MRLRSEPFDPQRVGYNVLSAFLSDFYEGPPWNEYRKCISCSSFSDFGPVGAFGREEVEKRHLTHCPHCESALQSFWSVSRVREYFSQLKAQGPLIGLAVFDGDVPAGWVWGYELLPDADSRYGTGAGMYLDVICIPEAYRNGIVAWYLILSTLTYLLESGHTYVVSRTHVAAENVRTLFRRLGFEELSPSQSDPQRTYWWRRVDSIGPEVLRTNYEALTRAAGRTPARQARV